MSTQPAHHDVLVIGAGAAGLFAAFNAGKRGKRVLVIDHAKKPAEKVRISGGGRCNFTNLEVEPARFLSNNPHFAKSALARYTPWDFISLISEHGITWHEKTLGQLFSDGRSEAIIRMLLDELANAGGHLKLQVSVSDVKRLGQGFEVSTSEGLLTTDKLVIATGGLSIPKMGATGFAYDLAKKFGHRIVTPRAALVPFTITDGDKAAFASISGVATPVTAKATGFMGGASFREAMLFTHRGLSGPAMLQLSSYWAPGEPLEIDLFDGADGVALLRRWKQDHPARMITNAFESLLPERLIGMLVEKGMIPATGRMGDFSHKALDTIASSLSAWRIRPSGTEGWRTAEVTAGGIDTRDLSSKTMESALVPGLYFIGECVDVTGWLGGYNFQWAWASGWAAAQAV